MSLTQTAEKTRKAIVGFGILVFVYYLSIVVIIPVTKNVVAKVFPEKDPPTLLYGTLPQLEFTQKQIKNTIVPKAVLDTRTGRLPADLPKKLPVYKFIKPVPLFQKGKDAIENAKQLGYSEDELVSSLKESVYKFRSIKTSAYLEINTDTKEILHDIPLANKGSFFKPESINQATAINYAKDALNKLNSLSDTLYANGTQTVRLGKISNTRILETKNTFDAELARVDFFRSINNYPILGPDPTKGLISMLVRRPESEDPIYNVPFLETHIWQIEQQSNATYPLIDINQAWLNITEGKGVITSLIPRNDANLKNYTPVDIKEIFINDIFIAYYDRTSLQNYLQPIYVFRGIYTSTSNEGGEITIYYPAISPENITASN